MHPIKLVALLISSALAIGANAGSLSLIPVSPHQDAVVTGDIVSFDVLMDFTGEPTLGGSFDLLYDASSLEFVSFFRDESIGDPQYSRDPDLYDGILEAWGVGSFTPLPAVAILGNVQFMVLPTMGTSTVVALAQTNGIGCTWIDANNYTDCYDVDYGTATISRVPLPAAGWLMICGVAALFGFHRKR